MMTQNTLEKKQIFLTLKHIVKNYSLPLLSGTLLIFYYSHFFNKGLVPGDEGYYLHIADRILKGETPYKDFFLQYPPGHFYLLALFFKIFGISITTGRILTVTYCIGIFITSIIFLKEFKAYSKKTLLIILLATATYGFPLLNIPIVVWATVLITILIMIFLIKWYKEEKNTYLYILGLLISLQLFTKQNIAIVEMILLNILLLPGITINYKAKIKQYIVFNSIWVIFTAIWIFIFFNFDNFFSLYEFIHFNQKYLTIYPFSYPPLSFLLEPTGILKLIPYYLPIIFLVLLAIQALSKKIQKKHFVFLLPLAGFFTSIYPTSDLLHVYPYFPLVLISIFLFAKDHSKIIRYLLYLSVCVSIMIGFYLTFFREYYRYYPSYNQQTTKLDLPRSNNIYIDKNTADSIHFTYDFIQSNTKKDEPIFVYSFSPMLYFVLERKNPSEYTIYFPGYLTEKEEKRTIQKITKSGVQYIISDAFGNSQRPLAQWIKSQEMIKDYGLYSIYRIQ